jgi:hypothetical protein
MADRFKEKAGKAPRIHPVLAFPALIGLSN